jgi:hypothetical protein
MVSWLFIIKQIKYFLSVLRFFQNFTRLIYIILGNLAACRKLRQLFVCTQLPSYSLSYIHKSTQCHYNSTLNQHGSRQRYWSELLRISVYDQVALLYHRGDCSWTQGYYSFTLHQYGSRQRAWSELLRIFYGTQVTVGDHVCDCSWTQCYYSSKLHRNGSRQRAWSELLRISDDTQLTVMWFT